MQRETVKRGTDEQRQIHEAAKSHKNHAHSGAHAHHKTLVRFLVAAGQGSRGASCATDAPLSASGSTAISISLSRCVSTSMPARACASRQ